jgi:hypothetical protein
MGAMGRTKAKARKRRPARGAAKPSRARRAKPQAPHFGANWHDHLVMLLHAGAEIEHALMVEYLYAAYSLGGEQVPEKHRPMVQRWRDSLLAAAREEMGHFLGVQNLLRLVGGPLNFARRNPPWDSPYFPFPFRLEPLSLKSVACYIYAEMPDRKALGAARGRSKPARFRKFLDHELERIERIVHRRAGDDAHRVGALYAEIIELVSDPVRIPDSAFNADSYSAQASWDEWGRGYQPDPVQLTATGNRASDGAEEPAGRPSTRRAHVLVPRMATRAQAIEALHEISGQGEALHLRRHDTGEPSHFERFLEIYQDLEKVKGWKPARDIPVNPAVPMPGTRGARRGTTPLEGARARDWGTLFNLRYRMLLAYLAHALRLPPATGARPALRSMVMHKVFGEMYALKSIAAVLVRTPLRDEAGPAPRRGKPAFAGPPFETPYTVALPDSERDAWIQHRDLLRAAGELCAKLRADGDDADARRYAAVLADIDRQSLAWVDQIIATSKGAQP